MIRSSFQETNNQHQVYFFISKKRRGYNLCIKKINVKVTLMLSSTLIKLILFAIEIFVFTKWNCISLDEKQVIYHNGFKIETYSILHLIKMQRKLCD